jgi:Tfp pilus assembly protein PilX
MTNAARRESWPAAGFWLILVLFLLLVVVLLFV